MGTDLVEESTCCKRKKKNCKHDFLSHFLLLSMEIIDTETDLLSHRLLLSRKIKGGKPDLLAL